MALDPTQFVARAADGSWEQALKAELLAEPEPSRLRFLADVLVLQEKSGRSKRFWFDMAKALLHDNRSYERLLHVGLLNANASSILDWLLCVRRLGVRKVLRVLAEQECSHPKEVEKAEYWLMRLAKTENERRLVSLFHRRHGGEETRPRKSPDQ